MRTLNKTLNGITNGPVASGYISGVVEYVENSVGSHTTSFDIDAAIGATWESVGPTGSGATNIWTALDSLSSGYKWLDLGCSINVQNTASNLAAGVVYARKTGDSTSIGTRTILASARTEAVGATATGAETYNTKRIPVDSLGRFDLYYLEVSASARTIDLYLNGWS